MDSQNQEQDTTSPIRNGIPNLQEQNSLEIEKIASNHDQSSPSDQTSPKATDSEYNVYFPYFNFPNKASGKPESFK